MSAREVLCDCGFGICENERVDLVFLTLDLAFWIMDLVFCV